MKVHETEIKGLLLVELRFLSDDRGFFTRHYCADTLREAGLTKSIKQINHTLTKKTGALRGLHFQAPPMSETKIVRCIRGSVFDVAVDLRAQSPTFLQWRAQELSAENGMLYVIPDGFAHGYQALTDEVEMFYLHTENYAREFEGGIRYDDPRLAIGWPRAVTDISERDINLPLLEPGFAGFHL